MKKNINISLISLLLLVAMSCKKLIEVPTPPNQLTTDKVFIDSSSVQAVTANLYTQLNTVDANFVIPSGIYTDELVTANIDATSQEFTNSTLTTLNSKVLSIWQNLYVTIYKANSLILGLQQKTSIQDSVKKQCLGEAEFIRAYCHFMLTNIYGDVPLITTTDVSANQLAARTPASEVYRQVIADLKDAVRLLGPQYPGDGEKVRANKWAAAALLAKVYLFTGDFSGAAMQSGDVINSGIYSLTDLNNVFLANSSEAILQLWNANGYSTLNTVPFSGKPTYQVTSSLFNAFETNDQRQTSWIGSRIVSGITYYFPFKYKQRTPTAGTNAEYSMYFRLAEQYLIRAEAEANGASGGLPAAISDLNVIRARAGLPGYTGAADKTSVLSAIWHERRIELFAEGGNRFFDLKRTGGIDSAMSLIKPLWRPAAALFPIPQSEFLKDPNLLQNPGYTN